ncbi:hypothetical protein FSP39_019162 [Pinctada imbricata]|uniref:Uncharacterized protein n=1 Tax=Pinctada imbricata TaxID=66713 RepID=A0AA88XQ79_PINIB|nr:hypothetical protein FSP39_019162 [Pinctada imbricata]
MSSLPTRRLRQRKSLPPRLGPTTRLSQSLNTANTNVNSPNSNLSPVKGEQVTTRKRESLPEKEQLPSNVQFMFNSLPSKNFPSSRLSDSSLNFHGDKFRRFGENVDHIYGVLKSSRRTQQTFDSISKTSPKKVKGRHLDAFRQDEIDNENKVFGDYPVGLLNHNEVIFPYNAKTQHGNMSSKQMNDKRKFLGLQVENRTKSEILLNTHDCKNNVGKKSSLVSSTAFDSDFSAKDCIPDRRQNRVNCLSVQNIKTEIEEEDSSDSDYEVTCNMQRVRSRLSSSRRTSGYNMEDYTDSSSYTSSEQSTPDRKRKRHSSEFSDTDYVPKKSRPVRKNAQIVPVPSPVRTQKLLLEVNEKLQQHMKNKESLKTTDVKEEREDIEMETRGGVNMKFAQGSECDPTEVKKKKDGRGRPRLPENRDKIYKTEVKKQRKPGSGRPRKYPIDPGSTRPRKFPTNPGSGNTKKYHGGPEKMFTQAKNRFTVLASQAKVPVEHDEPVRVDAKYDFAPNDEVDEAERKCYVKFDDNSKFWIMFKDLQKGAPDDDDDELCMCSVCNGGESEVPNEIVLCDSCGLEPQVEPEKQVTPLGNNVVKEIMKKTEEQFSEVNMCMGKNLIRKSPRRVRKSKQSEIYQYYGDTTDSMSGLEENILASDSFKNDCAKTRKSNRKCRRKVDDSYLFDDEVEGFLTQDEAWGKYMDKSPLFKTAESFDIKCNRADEEEGINIVKVEEPSSTDEGPNQDVPPTKYTSGNNPSGHSISNTESDLKIKFVKLKDRDNAYTVVDMSCKPACFPSSRC